MNIAIASDGSNIKTGDLVLVRNGKNDFWKLSIFYRMHVIGTINVKIEYECLNEIIGIMNVFLMKGIKNQQALINVARVEITFQKFMNT